MSKGIEVEKTLKFQLNKPIKYSSEGTHKETMTLEIEPPTIANRHEIGKIKGYISKAGTKVAFAGKKAGVIEERNKPESEETLDFEEKKGQIEFLMRNGGYFDKVGDIVIDLAVDCGTLDGNTRIKRTHLEKRISLEDYERLVVEYSANFTFPSR